MAASSASGENEDLVPTKGKTKSVAWKWFGFEKKSTLCSTVYVGGSGTIDYLNVD